jgi:hypothetical protein
LSLRPDTIAGFAAFVVRLSWAASIMIRLYMVSPSGHWMMILASSPRFTFLSQTRHLGLIYHNFLSAQKELPNSAAHPDAREPQCRSNRHSARAGGRER